MRLRTGSAPELPHSTHYRATWHPTRTYLPPTQEGVLEAVGAAWASQFEVARSGAGWQGDVGTPGPDRPLSGHAVYDRRHPGVHAKTPRLVGLGPAAFDCPDDCGPFLAAYGAIVSPVTGRTVRVA